MEKGSLWRINPDMEPTIYEYVKKNFPKKRFLTREDLLNSGLNDKIMKKLLYVTENGERLEIS